MAWAERLPSGHYRAVWRDDTGHRRSSSYDEHGARFTQERKAKNYGAAHEASTRSDPRVAHRAGGLTWGQWCAQWMTARRVEGNTLKVEAGRIEKHLMPRWGPVKLAKITRGDVEAWLVDLDRAGLAAETQRRCYYNLSRSLKDAVRAGHLTASPCQAITLPTPPPSQERFLTKAEFWLIRDHLTPAYYADAAVLLAYTGLRFGELAGLHWERVDLDRGLITVADTWDWRTRVMKAYPKSKRARVIPIPEDAAAVLARRPAWDGPCRLPHARGGCTTPLVMYSPTLLPLNPSTMRTAVLTACDLAGLPAIRLHDLRHTYASWLAQDGVPMQAVQAMLGHGNVTTTQRYSHLGPEQYTRVLDALKR